LASSKIRILRSFRSKKRS